MLNKLREFLSSLPLNRNVLTIVGLFVILAAIPLTVYLSQHQQELRQRAEQLPCPECDATKDFRIGGCDQDQRNCENRCNNDFKNNCMQEHIGETEACQSSCSDSYDPLVDPDGFRGCLSQCVQNTDNICSGEVEGCKAGCPQSSDCKNNVESWYQGCRQQYACDRPNPPPPQSGCTDDNGKPYNPGDKRYVCLPQGCPNYSAGYGYPLICNNDGSWTNGNNGDPECTDQCEAPPEPPTPTVGPPPPGPYCAQDECFQDGRCYQSDVYPELCPDGSSSHLVERRADSGGNCIYRDYTQCGGQPPPGGTTPTQTPGRGGGSCPAGQCSQGGACYSEDGYPDYCPGSTTQQTWVTRQRDGSGNCSYSFSPSCTTGGGQPAPTPTPGRGSSGTTPTPQPGAITPTPRPPVPTVRPPAPTSGSLPTPRPTISIPTATPIPPTPTRVPIPTSTPPPPTPTIPAGATALAVNVRQQVLASPPRNNSRQLEVKIFNNQNQEIKSENVSAILQNGVFTGTLNLGNNFATGPYIVKVKISNTLRKLMQNVTNITAGQTNTLAAVELYSGDINNDNELNAVDYANIVGCLDINRNTPKYNCPNPAPVDLNDDGNVTIQDLGILIFNFSHRRGD